MGAPVSGKFIQILTTFFIEFLGELYILKLEGIISPLKLSSAAKIFRKSPRLIFIFSPCSRKNQLIGAVHSFAAPLCVYMYSSLSISYRSPYCKLSIVVVPAGKYPRYLAGGTPCINI